LTTAKMKSGISLTQTEPKPYLLISLLFFFLQAQIYLKNNKKQNNDNKKN